VKITEQVAAFCIVITHSHKQMDVTDRLQRSLETISKYVNAIATAMCYLGKTQWKCLTHTLGKIASAICGLR
jgi:hypothetical protein